MCSRISTSQKDVVITYQMNVGVLCGSNSEVGASHACTALFGNYNRSLSRYFHVVEKRRTFDGFISKCLRVTDWRMLCTVRALLEDKNIMKEASVDRPIGGPGFGMYRFRSIVL